MVEGPFHGTYEFVEHYLSRTSLGLCVIIVFFLLWGLHRNRKPFHLVSYGDCFLHLIRRSYFKGGG